MGFKIFVARAEVRRRRIALFGLALMIGVSGSVVIAAVAGARRTSTALDRFLAASNTSDLYLEIDSLGDGIEPASVFSDLAEVEGVRAVAPQKFFFVDVGSEFDFGVRASPESRWLAEFDTPRVLHGRLPRDADEVALNEEAVAQLDLTIGDTLSGPTFDNAEFECLMAGGGCDIVGNGPELHLEVVGITRLPEDLNTDPSQNNPAALASSAFYDRYSATVGGWDRAAIVDLDPSAREDVVTGAIHGSVPFDTVLLIGSARQIQDTTDRSLDVLVVAILVFAVVAAVAGAFVAAQSITRQVAATAADLVALGSLGCTRRERAVILTLSLLPAAALGSIMAVLVAVAASAWFPFGLAGRAEPEPGIAIDGTVLLTGVGTIAASVALVALVVAWRCSRPTRSAATRRAGGVGSFRRLGVPVVPAAGARFAFDRGRGRGAVPARTAMTAAVLAFAGVIGSAAVTASGDRLARTPERWGHTWDLGPLDFGSLNEDSSYAGTREEALAALDAIADDDRLAAAAVLARATAELDGAEVPSVSLDVRSGSLDLSIVQGRAPTTAGEVALGRQTLDDLGMRIGDRVSAAPAYGGAADDRPARLVVVGRVVFPEGNEPGDGALFTPEGLDAHRRSEGEQGLVVSVTPGVDLDAAVAFLEDHGFSASAYAFATPPSQVSDLHAIRSVPLALGLFFGLLGTLSLAHVVLVTSRRRRHELGVLQALGLRPAQVRAIPPWQATAIVAVGAAIGIPCGVAVGRWVWIRIANGIGVANDLAVPLRWTAALAAVALALAIAVGSVSGRLAVRNRPADALRTE